MVKLIEITGKALSGEWGADDEIGTGIPVLRTTNFTNEGVVDYSNVVTRTITKKNLSEKYLRKGDIIIEKSGGSDKQPVGRVIYFDGPENTYLFNNFTGLLRVKNQEKWFPRYVFYSLFSNYRRGGTRAYENKTTGLHNLKTDDYVARYELTEANMDQQIAICEQLDKIYSVITMRQQELQKLDELVKARFVEMFEEYPYDSAIGDLTDISRGASPRPISNYITSDESGENWIKIGDADENDIYITKAKEKVTKAGADKSRRVKEGDFILSNSMSFGRPYILGINGCVHDGWLIISNYLDSFVPLFFYYLLRSENVQSQFNGSVNGAVVKNLNSDLVRKTKVCVPPIDKQIEFVRFAEQVDKSKFVIQQSLNETQKLFDSLMQEYFG